MPIDEAEPLEVEIIRPGQTVARNKKTGYKPTENEQRLLEVLLDPEKRLLPIGRQCELAGLHRNAYYRAMARPDFYAHYKDLSTELIKLHAGQLINVAIDHAKRGSFQHLKLLMEMGGLYVQQTQTEHTGEVSIKVSFVDPSADDDDE